MGSIRRHDGNMFRVKFMDELSDAGKVMLYWVENPIPLEIYEKHVAGQTLNCVFLADHLTADVYLEDNDSSWHYGFEVNIDGIDYMIPGMFGVIQGVPD